MIVGSAIKNVDIIDARDPTIWRASADTAIPTLAYKLWLDSDSSFSSSIINCTVENKHTRQ